MLPERAKAMRRICFDEEPSEPDLALLGSPERWLVYRDLVRSRLAQVVVAALPRTERALGQNAFGRVIDGWLGTGGPRTRYLREVPSELAAFAIPVWMRTEAPWVADLASYELAVWSVRHAPPNPSPELALDFDRRPVVTKAMQVLKLAHPVHQAPTVDLSYEHEPVSLLVYRDESHEPMTRELNALAADLLDAWQRGDETVTQSVERVAGAHGTEIGPAFVDKLAALIADLIERRVLLGSIGR